MEKLIRNGKVAVLVSGGYGAGWSTWNSEAGCEFNKRLALAVLGESGEGPLVVAKEEYPEAYHGGVEGLYVEWITKGNLFSIEEYDGNESIIYSYDNNGWQVA